MLKQAIFLSLCALLVSGCGSQYTLNIDTVPTGATIWQVGATSAYTTPVELAPDPNFRHPTTNCILVTQVHAKWQSGATVTSQNPIQLCGEFDTWTLTLKRPAGYPSLQIDLMVEQRILFERQLKADRGAAAMAAGFKSLGSGLGCLAAGGGCSSSDTSYSYSPQPQQQQEQRYKRKGYSPVLQSKPNRCPTTSPDYLTPSCLGE